MQKSYSTKDYNKERMARVLGRSLPVSTKHCIEICNMLRGRNTIFAKSALKDVITMKRAVRFTRFNSDVGHKKGIGPGRYPIKASKEVLRLVKSVESNAQFKGLNTSNLVIVHICAHKASTPFRYGRQRGRSSKRTHIEIIVEEKVAQKAAAKKPKAPRKALKETQEKEKTHEKEPKTRQEKEPGNGLKKEAGLAKKEINGEEQAAGKNKGGKDAGDGKGAGKDAGAESAMVIADDKKGNDKKGSADKEDNNDKPDDNQKNDTKKDNAGEKGSKAAVANDKQ